MKPATVAAKNTRTKVKDIEAMNSTKLGVIAPKGRPEDNFYLHVTTSWRAKLAKYFTILNRN